MFLNVCGLNFDPIKIDTQARPRSAGDILCQIGVNRSKSSKVRDWTNRLMDSQMDSLTDMSKTLNYPLTWATMCNDKNIIV